MSENIQRPNSAGDAAVQFSGDPARKLDWRFDRVQKLLSRSTAPGDLPSVSDDDFVGTMWRFIALQSAGTPAMRRQLAQRYSGPSGALQLREHGTRDLQLFVQCRILARQTDAEISTATGLAPEAIRWYELLFFNVRDRLDSPDWILACVLNPNCLETFSPLERPLKAVAYVHGPSVFEAIQLGPPREEEDPDLPTDVHAKMRRIVKGRLEVNNVLAAQLLDVGKFSPEQISAFVQRQQRLSVSAERASEDEDGMQAIHAACIRETIKQLVWVKGESGEEWMKKHQPEIYEYDKCAAELRDRELYAAIEGKDYSHLKNMKMPPPGGTRDLPPDPTSSASGG